MHLILAGLFVLSVAGAAAGQPAAGSGCLTCHRALPDARLSAPAAAFDDDVHARRGFACASCHGGDPAAAGAAQAKAPGTGFRGVPRGVAQVATCAGCHSDAELMRRFAPRQRVDQAAEFAVSVHGKRLAAGDTRVATCTSCHGAHGIRMVADGRSPVYPTNVAATCASCHASPSYMAGYTAADGSPVPTTQRAEYERSVHFAALTDGNDLSAPTCNDCHGNHGAAPPGVEAVANVCGTCHAVFETRLTASSHASFFAAGCVDCHGNHAVAAPSDAMLGVEPPATCAECHTDPDDPGYAGAAAMRAGIEGLKGAVAEVGGAIERLRQSGMEVTDQELALAEARNHLVLARTEVHAFAPASLAPVLAKGHAILATVEEAGRDLSSELQFRRRGLAVSMLAILVVVVALALKIRRLDRDEETANGP